MVHQKFHGSLPPRRTAAAPDTTVWPYPAYIAHRGGGRHAPENTLAGMRAAHAHGYAMVEYDVKLTLDDIPVLLHDDDVARTSTGSGRASEHTFSELVMHDYGSWHSRRFAGEPLPVLASIAASTRAYGMASNIELKPSPGTDARTGSLVVQAARRLWRGAACPPLISSFSEIALAAARDAAPELPRALLFEGRPPGDWRARLQGLDCLAVHVHHEHADAAFIDAVREEGYGIAAWTVNSPQRAAELFAAGCNAIFTDELDLIAPF